MACSLTRAPVSEKAAQTRERAEFGVASSSAASAHDGSTRKSVLLPTRPRWPRNALMDEAMDAMDGAIPPAKRQRQECALEADQCSPSGEMRSHSCATSSPRPGSWGRPGPQIREATPTLLSAPALPSSLPSAPGASPLLSALVAPTRAIAHNTVTIPEPRRHLQAAPVVASTTSPFLAAASAPLSGKQPLATSSPNSRPHLDETSVIQIFLAGNLDNVGTRDASLSGRLAQQYGVTAKTVRDIWSRRTWWSVTEPYVALIEQLRGSEASRAIKAAAIQGASAVQPVDDPVDKGQVRALGGFRR